MLKFTPSLFAVTHARHNNHVSRSPQTAAVEDEPVNMRRDMILLCI
jgi:hypothetical protein